MSVFLFDRRKSPLMPCSQRRARVLLERSRAVVHRPHPFTIRLRDRVGGETLPVEIRVDPGSKGTGIAVVRVAEETTAHVLEQTAFRHRADTAASGSRRLARLAPTLRFDTQALEAPEISGIEYQQGALFGYAREVQS